MTTVPVQIVRFVLEHQPNIVECVLTEAGSQFLDELTGVRIDAIRTALAALTPRELSGFRVLLSRIGARQGEPA